LNKPGVFILASPGCSRGLLVTELLRRGLVDAVYAYVGFGSKVNEDVRGRVNEFNSVDELAGKLGSANGRVVVVTKSTADAVRLRDKLGKAEVIYLPEYYKDVAKEVLSEGYSKQSMKFKFFVKVAKEVLCRGAPGVDKVRLARVRHEGLGEGISPSMLREDLLGKDVESIRELSPGKVSFVDLIKDFLKKAPIDAASQAIKEGLSFLLGVGAAVSLVGSLAGRFLEMVVSRWGNNRDEVIGGFVRLLRVARKVKNNYLRNERLRDERLEAVFDEVAYEWGLNIEEFAKTITNIANIAEGKQLTEEDIKKLINDNLENFKKELDKVKEKVNGLLADVKVFFNDDVENGLLYDNFIVVGGVPKIKTWGGTAKNDLETDLVDAGKFRKVAEEVFSRLVKNGRVVLVGPRGIGKSTLATYVVWRSLFGGLDNMVLNEPVYAVIRVDSLNPGYALALNNRIKTAGRRFVVIYDPSPIKAYYKPEAMQVVEHGKESDENITLKELIESVKTTLKELIEVRNAWVVIILPSELYEQVQRGKEEDVDLRQVLDNLERDVVTVDLKEEVFLREIIKRYSGCDNVSDDLVRRVMNFDSYTLVAKYVGIWLHEKKCEVEDVEKALRESAGKPKLFFAHYIWGVILGKSLDLAMKASVPLILHAAFGPIPEGITYITKAVNRDGTWKLIDRNELAKSKLEDLREDDLEPIAKWLSTWHGDLIEETLRELVGLHGEEARKHYIDHGFENLIKTLNRSYHEKALEEVRGLSREVKPEEVKSNLLIFVGERLKHALKPYTDCWKRAAFIIGHALTGHPTLPKPEDLPESLRRDFAESLGDALRECEVDYYLLVDNKIPPLIIGLVIMGLAYTFALAWAFIDKYNEAIGEVNRILNISRGRDISNAESFYVFRLASIIADSFYGLGLASIIADAVRLGRDVKPSDADIALRITLVAIKSVALPILITPILNALEPLHGKAPHRYLELLAYASNTEGLDRDTVRHIFGKLNEILHKYGDVVKEHAWPLVYAIVVYADLLWKYLGHFNSDEVKDMVGRVVYLLNELGKFESKLGVIAWAYALVPAIRHENVRRLMKEKLGIDVVGKASEVLEELNDMRERVQELMGDKEFMGYVESKPGKADEDSVKREILEAALVLKHVLAIYLFDNDELDKARDLFNEVAEELEKIGDYENELINRSWVLRVEAIKDSLVGGKLVDGFRQLYEETFYKKPFMRTARYLSTASAKLSNYLVSLALMGDHETINKLLEEHLWVLNANKQFSVLTRLMLNALLSPKGGLSSELQGKLSVNPEELVDAFESYIDSNSLPALRVALDIAKPEDGIKLCEEFNDEFCVDLVLAVKGNSVVVEGLREGMNAYINSLKRFGSDVEPLINEFKGLVRGLDGRSLVQLIATSNSGARLALMLRALINGNKELANAHALYGAIHYFPSKLLRRLFLEAYKECKESCDLDKDEFRRAIARLFFFHV